MKKLLIIIGSARNGNSEFISSSIVNLAHKYNNLDVKSLKLSNYKINYCDGCLTCDVTGKCHQQDDMAMILDDVKSSDAIIIISPTRWSLLSGDLKVMFDRWNPLAGKNLFVNKKCFNICVGQTDIASSVSITRALESLRFFVEDAGFVFEGQFAFENCYNSNDASQKTGTINELNVQIMDFLDKIQE